MKKFWLSVILALSFSTPCFANWEYVTSAYNEAVYIDRDSVRTQYVSGITNPITVVFVKVYDDKGNYQAMLVWFVNLNNGTPYFYLPGYNEYAPNGKLVKAVYYDNPKLKLVRPGTVMDAIKRAVC